MPTAILYTRVSSAEQVTGTSLAMQERDLRDWCKRNGYDVLEHFQDAGESAKTTDRPAFIQALHTAKQRKADAFVVWKLDRLARDTLGGLLTKKQLNAHGCALVSITEAIGSGPIGELQSAIMLAVSKYDNDIRADRSRLGMAETSANGGWCFPTPKGYVRDRLGNLPILKPDGSLSTLIADCIRGVINGTASKSDGMDKLHAAGLTRQQAFKVFEKPVYGGIIRCKLVPGDVKAAFDGIVTRAEWYKLEEILGAEKIRAVRNYENDDFPLVSVLVCPECGKPMRGAFSRGKSKKRYGYYWCPKNHLSIPSKDADKMLRELFSETETIVREFEKTMELAMKRVVEIAASMEKERDDARNKIERIRKKNLALLDHYNDGAVSRENYSIMSKTYESDIATLSAKLNVDITPTDYLSEITRHLNSWRGFYDIFVALQTPQKKRLLKLLFGRLSVSGEKIAEHSKECESTGVLKDFNPQKSNGTPKGKEVKPMVEKQLGDIIPETREISKFFHKAA